MPRHIDADEALRMMRNSKQDCPVVDDKRAVWDVTHDCAISCVEATPTADVVPRAEVEATLKYYKDTVKSKVAREIFEDLEAALAVHTFSGRSEDYADGAFDTLEWVDTKLAELKKKYTEGGTLIDNI